ncbi:hypothetical protein RHMOL_Rhmol08G0248200 [Rhododendron molle]|uniref:Uncharacterized protein n=1 Tax=Rhododendron molle TaxID=49168 RepID=A0ACC0MRZ0_RHOML|nr:hypothetical protein RHMOL_Rhmol08G0248200 [Rhododendron molle]
MKNGQEAACAAVVRNWNGKLINGHVISARVSSSLQGELLAIRLACGMGAEMVRPSENWEQLVRATLQREKLWRDGHERVPSGIACSVPPSLTRETNIDLI